MQRFCKQLADFVSDHWTPALKNQHILPDPIHLSELFVRSDPAEPGPLVDVDRRLVFWEDTCLDGPDTVRFRALDEPAEEAKADTLTSGSFGNIHAAFHNAGIHDQRLPKPLPIR